MSLNGYSVTLMHEEKKAIHNLNCALEEEESLMKQKSRIRWLHLGDGNTSFFFNQEIGRAHV